MSDSERDIEQLDKSGEYLQHHMNAMTEENLTSKAAIATELAYRDKRIRELSIIVEELKIKALLEHDRLTDQMLTMYTYDDMKEHGERLLCTCIEIAKSLSHRSDDMGAIIANNIKRQFGL